jgi:phosphosulfolactate phosphohydrolase-like enzyme
MFAIELCRANELAQEPPAGHAGAVVVDLFRATSTLQILVDDGHPVIEVVATPQAARSALDRGHRCVGEWLGSTPPGFSCGNSPVQVHLLEPAGPPVTFLSSNGAGALIAAGRTAGLVLAGNLFNVGAVRQIMLERGGRWLLVPAGARGVPCVEDDFVCAGLARSLTGSASFGERIDRLVGEFAGVTVQDLAHCEAAGRLARTEPTGRDDVEFILAGPVRSPRVPVYAGGAVTAWPGTAC